MAVDLDVLDLEFRFKYYENVKYESDYRVYSLNGAQIFGRHDGSLIPMEAEECIGNFPISPNLKINSRIVFNSDSNQHINFSYPESCGWIREISIEINLDDKEFLEKILNSKTVKFRNLGGKITGGRSWCSDSYHFCLNPDHFEVMGY